MLADMLLVKVASWKPGVIMSKRYGMIFRNAELVFATCVGFGYLACAGVNLHGMPNQRIRLFVCVCVCGFCIGVQTTGSFGIEVAKMSPFAGDHMLSYDCLIHLPAAKPLLSFVSRRWLTVKMAT